MRVCMHASLACITPLAYSLTHSLTHSSARATTVPRPTTATSNAILNLFRNRSATQTAASTTNAVCFRDTDGDRIIFKIEKDGSMTYYVNRKVKVHHLTKLEARNNHNGSVTISLNGKSGGSWSPARVTTVPKPATAISNAILNLFRRRHV